MIENDGIFSQTRVPHGKTNENVHIQGQLLEYIPPALHKHILCWMNDVLLHEKSFRELLDAMGMIFSMFKTLNLKLQTSKCIPMKISFKHPGKRTKRAAASVKLSDIGWSYIHQLAFDNCKRVLEEQVTSAHHDNEKRLCFYKDASCIA